jgi:hypothetical protein
MGFGRKVEFDLPEETRSGALGAALASAVWLTDDCEALLFAGGWPLLVDFNLLAPVLGEYIRGVCWSPRAVM